jgi:hypothetical protein
MKKKKQSIVLFEDWIKYARCLTDNEFRQFVNAIFEYYEGVLPEFTDNLKLVWEDCIPDLEQNVEKLNKKRVTMKSNARANPKLNITPETRPDIGPEIEPNTVPDSSGMVDGRWEMGDERLEIEDERLEITEEFIVSQFHKGMTTSSLIDLYPDYTGLIKSAYLDFDF